jgi:8-oxo-dGTP diphosphatase
MIADGHDDGDNDLMPPRDSDVRVTKAFGRVCLLHRKRQAADREEVARRAGISAVTLGRIERGEREPSLGVFIQLAHTFRLTPGALMDATVEELAAAPPSVAVCYVVVDGKLLMGRRRIVEAGLEWAGPSGSLQPGETPEQAAVRECLEEVGVEVEVTQRLGDRIHPGTGRHLIYLACRYVSGEPRVVADAEITAVEWVPVAEALERFGRVRGGVYPKVREYLERAMMGERT